MSARHVVCAVSAVAMLIAFGCTQSHGADGVGGGGGSGDGFNCCINGDNYTCPDQASLDMCAPPNLDPSGCMATGSPNGTCN